MFTVGCHLAIGKGFLAMSRTALDIGANTFQYFTRNPRGGAVRARNEKDESDFCEHARENGITTPLAHAPYTLNPCSDKESVRDFTRRTMLEDLERLEYIQGAMYNFHPGSHVGQGVESGITFICDILNAVLTPGQRASVLLETMAGKGSEIGGEFEHLREIIDRTSLSERLGVCFDTCHVFDAGYNIADDLDGVLTQFDAVIGLSRLKAVHLNDSKNALSSRKDRHEKIGDGSLGVETFKRIINHPALRDTPFYLETPNELAGYAEEIALLRTLRQPI